MPAGVSSLEHVSLHISQRSRWCWSLRRITIEMLCRRLARHDKCKGPPTPEARYACLQNRAAITFSAWPASSCDSVKTAAAATHKRGASASCMRDGGKAGGGALAVLCSGCAVGWRGMLGGAGDSLGCRGQDYLCQRTCHNYAEPESGVTKRHRWCWGTGRQHVRALQR